MEISWNTATRTANGNVRIAGTVTLVRDGKWEFRLDSASRKGTWWAKDLETGEIVRTGQTDMVGVRQFMYARRVQGNQGYTIASGPERSRAGDQRYSKAFAA